MADVNELLHDALVRRQIYLQGFGTGLTQDVLQLLDDTVEDLQDRLARRLEDFVKADPGLDQNKRLRALIEIITDIREKAFNQIGDVWDANMRGLSEAEVDYIDRNLRELAPVVLDTIVPSVETLGSLVSNNPFQGRTMKEWAEKIQGDDLDRIIREIRIGGAQGQTRAEISRRIFGSPLNKGADGILTVTRRDAEAITRTATNFFANEAKKEFYLANDDIIKQEQFLATLDSRTTIQCASLDGEVYPVGEGPRPPLHWRCRSLRIPVVDGLELSKRPAKSYLEADLEGLSKADKRAKIRELTGREPGGTTYEEFLGRQTEAYQDHVLGPVRAQLFRDGDLPLGKFTDDQGNVYTLDELKKREPEAFRRAGV